MSAPPPPPSFGGAPPPPAYEQPVSKIELRVSCRNLVDMDVLSKSDPFVVLFMQHQGALSTRFFLSNTLASNNSLKMAYSEIQISVY